MISVDKHVVKYGLSKDSLNMEAEGKSWTYTAKDMCGPAANTTGFKDPGYMFDVLLTKLEPMTTYFYSYGSEGVSLTKNFYEFSLLINLKVLSLLMTIYKSLFEKNGFY